MKKVRVKYLFQILNLQGFPFTHEIIEANDSDNGEKIAFRKAKKLHPLDRIRLWVVFSS